MDDIFYCEKIVTAIFLAWTVHNFRILKKCFVRGMVIQPDIWIMDNLVVLRRNCPQIVIDKGGYRIVGTEEISKGVLLTFRRVWYQGFFIVRRLLGRLLKLVVLLALLSHIKFLTLHNKPGSLFSFSCLDLEIRDVSKKLSVGFVHSVA